MTPETDDEGAKLAGRLSRDKRRLLIGLAFMALLLGSTLLASFWLGRPAPGADLAPGVPLLVLLGWGLVLGAAVAFYRTYPGGEKRENGDADDPSGTSSDPGGP